MKSNKTVTVTVGEATGKAPADFCRYHGEVYGVAEGRLTVMKSDKDALTVGEDGFLGPFANEGDKVSWQVQAPWSGQFLLNVTFNGKWGGKQNSFVVNGVAPQAVAFPQTDEQGQQLRIPVTLKAGSNQIDFGRFAGDWGYMFIKSIEVVAEYVQVAPDGRSLFRRRGYAAVSVSARVPVGAAASGPQTEGVTNKRHRSIWDSWFAEQPERFYQQVGPQTVCDTYHQYPQDVALMKQTGFNSFRTSIQWSRLIADLETGAPDPDAVRFYHAYLDEMIANGIEPMINLYHFDMPEALQKQYGGFESAHVAELFARFARTAFSLFGHKVKYWITFNEPIVPVEGGYLYDFHYPCKKDGRLAAQVAFNIMLAHAKAVTAYRELALAGEIGVVLNLTPSYTLTDSDADKKPPGMPTCFLTAASLTRW